MLTPHLLLISKPVAFASDAHSTLLTPLPLPLLLLLLLLRLLRLLLLFRYCLHHHATKA